MAAANINVITSQLIGGQDPGKWDRQVVERPIPTADVQKGLTDFIAQVETMLKVTCQPLGEFQLEEVSLTAEISPEGIFKLVGTNAPAVSGGVRLTLKRKHTMHTADLGRVLIGTEPIDDVDQNKLRANLTTLSADPPVRVKVEGSVPVEEQNLPLPVVGF